MNIEYYPDFFNDVFGPVMQPGSSSHTAGPCRIGYIANGLLKDKVREIQIQLDPNGSFSGTFGLMNEDLGMLAGAYGLLPDDERMFRIREILQKEGISYCFQKKKIQTSSHPNAVTFHLKDRSGNSVFLTGNSTGGGMVEIVDVMGKAVRFLGDKEENITIETQGKKESYTLKRVLPIASSPDRRPQLFDSFSSWRNEAEKRRLSLAETAILYEQYSSGLSREDVISKMKDIQTLLTRETEHIYENETDLLENPYSGYHFRQWEAYRKSRQILSGSVIESALHYMFGTQALQKGVKLVPGPMGTGGGFLFSALRAVKENRGFTQQDLLRALFVSAGVGAIAYTRTNPTGEIIGCMGECGICSAMASAGIVEMAGGTARQTEAAASLALQAAIGWPCDPIPGGQNQPCLSRFTTAVVMAIVFADLALSGKDAVLPFHEVVDEADRLGRKMPSGLLCTSRGGLCMAPAARRCKKEFEDYYTERK